MCLWHVVLCVSKTVELHLPVRPNSLEGPVPIIHVEQRYQTQLTWGPLEVESGSGWATSSIPQKKVAQLTQSKLMIGL